jgi:hypothetical protein
MQVANSRVGDHQGMELLRDSCSPICKVDVQLPKVLLKEGDGDILRAEVGRVARAGDLHDRQQPPRHLLLEPQHIYLDVPHFVQAHPLRHANGGAGIHPDDNSWIGYSKIGQ